MAESTPNADATSDASAMPAGVAEAVPNPADADLGDAGKRALAEERKRNRELAARLSELETAQRERDDAEKSELEKATRDRDEATSKATVAERKAMQMEAAIKAGIPEHWSRLNGSTADELDKDATAFAETLGKTPPDGNGATPATLGAGPRPGTPATGTAGFSETIRQRARR